ERCSILNTYEVFANDSNDKWKSILNFEEQSSWKSRVFCCSARPFWMRAWTHDETVLLMHRPYGCPASTDNCLPHRLEVKLPDDTPLGSIVRTFGCCESAFKILDAEGTPRLLLKGSCMASNWCLDFVFKDWIFLTSQIHSVKGGRSIGRIIREWRDDCDVFYIAFPRDLHVVLKLLVMSSTVL
ncbi:Scramblase, partial [Opisthorchis viverrini]